jgi:hypothetical protein
VLSQTRILFAMSTSWYTAVIARASIEHNAILDLPAV